LTLRRGIGMALTFEVSRRWRPQAGSGRLDRMVRRPAFSDDHELRSRIRAIADARDEQALCALPPRDGQDG